MTAPIIPADQWPAAAIDLEQFRCHIERSKRYLAVCTDSSGGSSIARELADADRLLALIDGQSSVRSCCELCSQPAPAIDLEQFREAVTYFRDAYAASSLGPDSWQSAKAAEADRLLALIDGQASQHPDSVLLDSGVIRYPSRNEFGEQCHVIHRGLDLRACIAAGIEESKPSKGEGVADGR